MKYLNKKFSLKSRLLLLLRDIIRMLAGICIIGFMVLFVMLLINHPAPKWLIIVSCGSFVLMLVDYLIYMLRIYVLDPHEYHEWRKLIKDIIK